MGVTALPGAGNGYGRMPCVYEQTNLLADPPHRAAGVTRDGTDFFLGALPATLEGGIWSSMSTSCAAPSMNGRKW